MELGPSCCGRPDGKCATRSGAERLEVRGRDRVNVGPSEFVLTHLLGTTLPGGFAREPRATPVHTAFPVIDSPGGEFLVESLRLPSCGFAMAFAAAVDPATAECRPASETRQARVKREDAEVSVRSSSRARFFHKDSVLIGRKTPRASGLANAGKKTALPAMRITLELRERKAENYLHIRANGFGEKTVKGRVCAAPLPRALWSQKISRAPRRF